MPVEMRSGIGLASRRDIAVARQRFDRIAAPELGQQSIEGKILGILERELVAAFELDSDREIIAARPSHPARNTGMPGPP